jgi:DNA replication protein DnaC
VNEPVPIGEVMRSGLARLAEKRKALEDDPVLKAEIERRLAEAETAKAEEARFWRRKALETSGVPRRLLDKLAAPEEREALRAAREWSAGSKTFLFLAGDPGVGKTFAAAWLVSELGGLFRKTRDVIALSQYDGESWQGLYRASFLALDDLGAEALDGKDWGAAALRALIDRRYDDEARTIVTLNIGLDTLRDRYGQDGGRLFRRLAEAGEWVEIAAEPAA